MSYHITKRTSYLLATEEDKAYELAYEPVEDSVEIHELPDKKRAVVGYLTYDEFAENPLENCDTLGRILRHTRDASWAEREECESLLRKADPYTFPLAAYIHGGQRWALADSREHQMWPDQRWDVVHCAGVWTPNDVLEQEIMHHALRQQLPAEVDIRWTMENGKAVVSLTIPGHKPYTCKSFVDAAEHAVKVLGIDVDTKKLLQDGQEYAQQLAEQALDEYNAWLSGEVFVAVCETHELLADGQTRRLDMDTVRGYYGYSCAQEALKEQLDCALQGIAEVSHA